MKTYIKGKDILAKKDTPYKHKGHRHRWCGHLVCKRETNELRVYMGKPLTRQTSSPESDSMALSWPAGLFFRYVTLDC